MAQFRKHIAVVALVATSGLLVACGSDDDRSSNDPSAATTTTNPMGGIDNGSGGSGGSSGTGAPEDVNPNNPGSDDQAPAEAP